MWFFGQEELEHPQDPDVPPVFDRQGKLKNVSRPWVVRGGCRPSDKEEGRHPDPEIRGGVHPDPEIRGAVSKNFFSALRASVWSRNNENKGGAPPPHVPRKRIRIPESKKILICKFRSPGKFCSLNPESWALESRI